MNNSVALIMRRPNMLRYNTWISECVEYLQNSSAAAPSDKRLAAWVQLLSILEEIATSFSFEDLTKIAKIAHPQTLCMLKEFEKRLSEWRIGVNPEIMIGMQNLCGQEFIQTADFDQVLWQSCTTTRTSIFMRLRYTITAALGLQTTLFS